MSDLSKFLIISKKIAYSYDLPRYQAELVIARASGAITMADLMRKLKCRMVVDVPSSSRVLATMEKIKLSPSVKRIQMKKYHIYGDNIVECERMLDLIAESLELSIERYHGNPSNAIVTAFREHTKENFEFVFFPGYSRWQNDVLQHMKNMGGTLREAADCVVTEVVGQSEKVIFALEFSSALPAGNNAWQRMGRAYSIAQSGVPYVYLTDIGGYELNSETRESKNPRMPSPIVPFSFLTHTQNSESICAIIYQMSPSANDEMKRKFGKYQGTYELCELIRNVIANYDVSEVMKEIEKKALNVVREIAKNPMGWNNVYNGFIKGIEPLDSFILHLSPLWKKTISGKVLDKLPDTFSDLYKESKGVIKGIGVPDIPISLVTKDMASDYYALLERLYPSQSQILKEQFDGNQDIALCWITGFKPRGDDSRPDRGLLPLLRMLVGENVKVISIVYGPGSVVMWKKFIQSPQELAERNGLWEVIYNLSDFILADSINMNEPVIAPTGREVHTGKPESLAMNKNELYLPKKYGEHDVDSIIHIVFKHLLNDSCFECMCNPPGGDWSGVSLLNGDNEYRWLSLPRVSRSNSKRPDHILQFDYQNDNIILSIESKDFLRNLEKDIGPSLVQYCEDLFLTSPNAERVLPVASGVYPEWKGDVGSVELKARNNVSAVAYILGKDKDKDVEEGLIKSNADICFGLSFLPDGSVDIFVLRNKDNEYVEKIVDSLINIKITNELKINFIKEL
ncbi:hypothetical protein ACEWA0_20695 [Vibrio parahaemolyticus]|uniref:hypothetical protein n=1 Tax=Vibrio parahaemolyticus TaxID=670 RepID=UPI002361D26F|nr:hypothetical protein [Vibrio parahaemolyticus]HCG7377873.1 hypothetical protein [Vibrio parahaemolyticus]